jgi:hypothetical protein
MKNPVLLQIGGGKLDAGYSELDLGSSSVGGWRQIEKRMSNNEYRISNVEGRNSIDFLKD